jgi:hypothetical protein
MNPEEIAKRITEDPDVLDEGWEELGIEDPGFEEEPSALDSEVIITRSYYKPEDISPNAMLVMITTPKPNMPEITMDDIVGAELQEGEDGLYLVITFKYTLKKYADLLLRLIKVGNIGADDLRPLIDEELDVQDYEKELVIDYVMGKARES